MLYLSGKKVAGRPLLWTPATGYRVDDVPVFAVDNGCFTGRYPGDDEYLRKLDQLAEHQPRCLWVAVPDVVGDAPATLALWPLMAARIRSRGWRVALVLQDGMTTETLTQIDPRPDALFIGGSDTYKLGAEVRRIVAEWDGPAHMGRVNSYRRMRYAAQVGVDTVDGTVLAFDQTRPVWSWADSLAYGLW